MVIVHSALPRRVLPDRLGLPRSSRRVGVHIAAFEACSSFTRVTACQVARPPIRGLCHEVSACPVTQTRRSIAIESNHQLFEWVLPPLVICPFGAHRRLSARQADSLRHGGCHGSSRAATSCAECNTVSHEAEPKNARSYDDRGRGRVFFQSPGSDAACRGQPGSCHVHREHSLRASAGRRDGAWQEVDPRRTRASAGGVRRRPADQRKSTLARWARAPPRAA